ncbi:4-coumarate--CoA ligase 3 [Aphelenchoides fujianensis]|nr:4-coumarate--CoA ligase 3 [Aphelenchoides fujianensis]
MFALRMARTRLLNHWPPFSSPFSSPFRRPQAMTASSDFIFRSEFPPVPLVNEPLNETLYRAIERGAADNRTAFVLAETGREIAYTELKRAILCISEFLEEQHFGPKDIACAVVRNCWQFPAIFISCALDSAAACRPPRRFSLTATELARQFADSHSKIVFVQQYALQEVVKAAANCPKLSTIVVIDGPTADLPANAVHLDSILAKKPKAARPNFYTKIDVRRDILALPYSSGTSGPPKGTMLTHYGLGNLLKICSAHFNERVLFKIDPNWRFEREFLPPLASRSTTLIYGFGMLLYGLLNSGRGVILEKFEPELFLQSVEKYKIKLVALVPPIVIFLSRSPLVDKYDLSSLQFLFSGAAPLGKEVIEAVQKRLKNIRQISQAYGMTEESMCSHPCRCSGGRTSRQPAG